MTQTQTQTQKNKMIIRKIDDTTIEVELKLHIRANAEVNTVFRQRRMLGYFNEVKNFIRTMTEEGVVIPLYEYARYVAQPLGTDGVRISDGVIEVENEELIYLTIRYLMLRRGYMHDVAIKTLLLYDGQIRYEWTMDRRMLELALLALNSTDFETAADMFDRLYNEVKYKLWEAEDTCKKRIEKLKEECQERLRNVR